ncbi:uncharacterized protein SCHCODRAFT_02618786 [Schizophyllum commune H4-8]|uniref:uncharacterized protein n=1 Tax=Schizophyllum commune (strain H4-8 / FGSC 9210) TaxID=578458 RepID=UPI0021608B4A|nr:uncharacterized protein SCHCODRAFT_02618786 [Schizophyllum commune H4-8]KAI5895208.1 hypothetical protein SCHCODRAFT_02618786 [Schizophyllum commune H4-8]
MHPFAGYHEERQLLGRSDLSNPVLRRRHDTCTPPSLAQRRETSLSAHNRGCKRKRSASTTVSSIAEAMKESEQLLRHHVSARDEHRPTDRGLRVPLRCPPAVSPSTGRSRRRCPDCLPDNPGNGNSGDLSTVA